MLRTLLTLTVYLALASGVHAAPKPWPKPPGPRPSLYTGIGSSYHTWRIDLEPGKTTGWIRPRGRFWLTKR